MPETRESQEKAKDVVATGKAPVVLEKAATMYPERAPGATRFRERYLGNSHLQPNVEGRAAAEQARVDTAKGGGGGAIIQAKMMVSQPGDKYEQEADRIADLVMRMPDPVVPKHSEGKGNSPQTKPLSSQITPLIQPKQATDQSSVATFRLETRIQALGSGGQPLSEAARAFFEPRLGCDLGRVRIHSSAEANKLSSALKARAFTTGWHVFLGHGEYTHSSPGDRQLLAHELTHILQQTGSLRNEPVVNESHNQCRAGVERVTDLVFRYPEDEVSAYAQEVEKSEEELQKELWYEYDENMITWTGFREVRPTGDAKFWEDLEFNVKMELKNFVDYNLLGAIHDFGDYLSLVEESRSGFPTVSYSLIRTALRLIPTVGFYAKAFFDGMAALISAAERREPIAISLPDFLSSLREKPGPLLGKLWDKATVTLKEAKKFEEIIGDKITYQQKIMLQEKRKVEDLRTRMSKEVLMRPFIVAWIRGGSGWGESESLESGEIVGKCGLHGIGKSWSLSGAYGLTLSNVARSAGVLELLSKAFSPDLYLDELPIPMVMYASRGLDWTIKFRKEGGKSKWVQLTHKHHPLGIPQELPRIPINEIWYKPWTYGGRPRIKDL
jgi:hypothetical protein